jgi:hypothetical protein
MSKRVYYNGDYKPLEKTVEQFARKMSMELGEDLKLSKQDRSVVFCHVYNCFWEPLVSEIVKDQKRKKKLQFTK